MSCSGQFPSARSPCHDRGAAGVQTLQRPDYFTSQQSSKQHLDLISTECNRMRAARRCAVDHMTAHKR